MIRTEHTWSKMTKKAQPKSQVPSIAKVSTSVCLTQKYHTDFFKQRASPYTHTIIEM